MSLAPVTAFASSPPQPPRAGPSRRRRVRLKCVQADRESYPYLGDVTPEGVEFWHHASKQSIPLPWDQLLHAAREVCDCTDEQLLKFLAERLAAAGAAANTSPLPSGPSAPTSETEHGQPGGRTERR
jgi:hypothetical protein